MKIADVIYAKAIIPRLKAVKRDDVIRELVDILDKAGKIGKNNTAEIAKAVIKRENEASTGIGKGVAVPHIKHKAVKKAVAAIGISATGIDFSALDKQPVYTVILLISPTEGDQHLQAMEAIFGQLQNDNFRKFLKQSETVDQIKELLTEAGQNPSW
ncbi:MAG: PTS sugar transporter subunit IIA [Planctomycetes bacterium]|nr:PTS sugar transporter subunit IIA [Planctomycetota bacterium]MBU1518584.1 PTS sugar transporter subunit IIA [Planctomycetota bacterium]MBU2458477.1 PTS sugar transporter subunit IIA [Planctomycetota bacterium]MBU2596229.1 PTS sugar transporter subunit IIA [Planctomycetota bacterium]